LVFFLEKNEKKTILFNKHFILKNCFMFYISKRFKEKPARESRIFKQKKCISPV
jgi:hypothetical protein